MENHVVQRVIGVVPLSAKTGSRMAKKLIYDARTGMAASRWTAPMGAPWVNVTVTVKKVIIIIASLVDAKSDENS
tara:strand:- start:342 stop:566 length:225 start_codon:yes stop_codon:yes gene_type:complete